MAKRTMSIRRHNFSDGFFSSEDEEVAQRINQANANSRRADDDSQSDAGLSADDGNLRNTTMGKNNVSKLSKLAVNMVLP